MKKFIPLLAIAAGTMEQPLRAGWTPLFEQQQQAKTGVVLADDDSGDPTIAAIAAADPLRATAGAVAVEALRATADAAQVVVTIKGPGTQRRVGVIKGATMADMAAAADAVAGTTLVGNLTFDNGSKNNDSVSNAVANGTGTSTQINAKLATRKPSFSLSALINALEDVAVDEEKNYVVLFDQNDNGANGRVKVFEVDTEAHADDAGNAAVGQGAFDAAGFQVDTTPASVGEKLAGE